MPIIKCLIYKYVENEIGTKYFKPPCTKIKEASTFTLIDRDYIINSKISSDCNDCLDE